MDVSSLKVAELKDELNKRGLSTAGLKQELANRLQDAINDKIQPDSEPAQAAPAESEPIGDPSNSAKGDPCTQTTPPAVKKAEEDDSVPIGDAEMKEQVLGDTDGDLGDAMKEAEEEGKQERKAEEADTDGDLGDAMKEAEEEGKQERKAEEAQDVDEHKDEEGITEQTNVVNGETQLQGVKEVEAGNKRKRNDGDDSMEVEENAKKARTGDAEMQADSRTEDEATSAPESAPEPASEPAPVPARDPFEDIPNPLPHTQHPPTKAIYIDNLRRPLDMPGLKDLLEENGELDDSEVSGGVWVSGVKSHVYAIFKTVDDATKAGLALHHLEFQPIAKTRLHVEFVPSTLVPSLISQEEAAWKDGRKQMSLVIQTVPLGQGYDGSSRKVAVVQAKTGGNVPGRRVPGLAHAPPPPTPFRARPGVAGIGGAAVVQGRTTGAVNSIPIGQATNAVAGKGMSSAGPARQVVAPGKPERETRGFMRTRTRPVLFYREAPRK